MAEDRLDKIFDVLVENDVIDKEAVSAVIKENLKFELRPYQIEAFTRFNYYLNDYKKRRKPTQLLFHMATGSGKTLVMAGAMLELYKMGYRNFIFFVNTDTIIRKTKENFLNPLSSKYLFSNNINIDGQNITVKEVQNFESINNDDINILFSTIQGLHTKLNNPQENSITFDDFFDKEVVLISDEAHHINTLTKKKLTGSELEVSRSWETTVTRIFEANVNNVMLEFTATLELTHPNVAAKYNSKLLFDYPLKEYRADGYSKEVRTNQIDFDVTDRALVSIIISQYKKKIFSDNGLLIKPVVMMKSKTTNESAENEVNFINAVKNLSVETFSRLKGLQNETLQKAFTYFDTLGITNNNLIDELKDDFSEDKIISVNSKNDTDEKQIVINSLEDKNNEYRVVFAVDKLNEGWDVLNLFDIVRLYNTRDAKGGKPGKTTVQEAQLIGRGARYYPFVTAEGQERYKRKFDNDLDNEMRICETLHYHCSHNPRYIEELNNALREIGIIPDERVEVDLVLKDDFKETQLYKSGFIWLNKKVDNSPAQLLEYKEPNIKKSHEYRLKTAVSQETTVFSDAEIKTLRPAESKTQNHQLINWDKTIVKKAMNALPFFRYSNLKEYFPTINSVDDFIKKYLADVTVTVSGLAKDVKELTAYNQLLIAKSVFTDISNEINVTFGRYLGTKAFYKEPIRKYFRDKKLSFALNENGDAETGRATLRANIPEKFYINLLAKDWYAYKENYGSSEEKFLVKFIDAEMESLQKRFKEVYLLRNERFFKLYRFSDGKATEPDYVMFMTDKKTDENLIYQLFIEPKGSQLLLNDSWKEDFLKEIEHEAKVELFQNERFKLIGMPFYNEAERKTEFKKKLDEVSG
ncbi:DEAD/DEAH box helicase family protein [Flavobacterium salilacus subsp. salilacus]|uniref:DEAD/DEAH box helicase family protein n=1 Tax=Flavobacterium TaxID=237 RepID=UPI001075428B|nr:MULTISPECIES: DEAD/DEAH box helicase family protein [Flavobacterium]KAF2515838.1 DEAD/DEAH box helicase family protein [Flavobacterium salilacus subsp. salilacus]MBE1615357.1 DEAD/DEAH box helicase family protein [Flavobacterium sp. SaA2.13]